MRPASWRTGSWNGSLRRPAREGEDAVENGRGIVEERDLDGHLAKRSPETLREGPELPTVLLRRHDDPRSGALRGEADGRRVKPVVAVVIREGDVIRHVDAESPRRPLEGPRPRDPRHEKGPAAREIRHRNGTVHGPEHGDAAGEAQDASRGGACLLRVRLVGPRQDHDIRHGERRRRLAQIAGGQDPPRSEGPSGIEEDDVEIPADPQVLEPVVEEDDVGQRPRRPGEEGPFATGALDDLVPRVAGGDERALFVEGLSLGARPIPPGEDRGPAAGPGQRVEKEPDEGRLARAAEDEIPHADHGNAKGCRWEDTVAVRPPPAPHDGAEGRPERTQDGPESDGGHVAALAGEEILTAESHGEDNHAAARRSSPAATRRNARDAARRRRLTASGPVLTIGPRFSPAARSMPLLHSLPAPTDCAALRDRVSRILLSVTTPGQYIGGEVNAVVKLPDEVDVRVALCFPDTYAVGMSHLGLKILYGLLNALPGVQAERVFAPWTDMRTAMTAAGIPLWSLETFTPLHQFDVVGFSLQYELSFATVVAMLDLGGIPLRAADRGPGHPLVIAGGPIACNAEPLADFIDVFIAGDGEDAAVEIVGLVREARGAGVDRESLLRRLAAHVPGAYVPALYDVAYEPDGRLRSMTPRFPEVPARVESAAVADLDAAYFPTRPVIPFVKVIQDRMMLEIMRGCSQGCRFCHAGYTKRPVRHRRPETLLRHARELYRNTGYDEIALTSLSSADYPFLREAVGVLEAEFTPRRVSLSLPSLRINAESRDIPRLVSAVRKAGLTFAPEAGSEILRKRINKNISDADLMGGVEAAWDQGWDLVKLYFLLGCPDETDADVLAINALADRVSQSRSARGQRRGRVNVSVSTFVPKAHTPCQWSPMATPGEVARRQALLRNDLRNRAIRLRFSATGPSEIEGVLSRGDRRLGAVLLEVVRRGGWLEAWDEHFDGDRWRESFAAAGLDPAWYIYRPRDADEVFPWDIIDIGVSRKYLARERRQAAGLEFTTDCRTDACHGCGVDPRTCFV